MSHLSTIIDRVKRKLDAHKGNMREAGTDGIFEQAVINLMEYQDAWGDQTADETAEANRLYKELRQYFHGNGMPSHKARLNEADAIYSKLTQEQPAPWKQYPQPDGPLDEHQCPRCYYLDAVMIEGPADQVGRHGVLKCPNCGLDVQMGASFVISSDDPKKLKGTIREMLGQDPDEDEDENEKEGEQ